LKRKFYLPIILAYLVQASAFAEEPAKTVDPAGPLQAEASGWLVEALQRTLNASLKPSPELNINGHFDAATVDAVKLFQASHNLPMTGTVNRQTWHALGPLHTSENAIIDPAAFVFSSPADLTVESQSEYPFVTCKAWIAGDAQTGKVYGGENCDATLEMASTTKLMTAWITLQAAKSNPELLDELATVSSRADRTGGSTANVHEGEKVTIRDLLYGLLLPSGNDASVVLGEHLGTRFEPPANNSELTVPLSRFVAEMNREAIRLGLTKTHFANTHGISATDHHTSARDLFQLAVTMSRDGDILPYLQTRQAIGKLTGSSGYLRYQLWTNSNQLLNTQGYLGMKTGTTPTAGACIVSMCERNGDRVILVVLGSASDASRYTDSRNLYRWVWEELAHRSKAVTK
jgi:D-alanyl-D-alanine carboxypeptidase